jgi:hypothetical protein
LGFLAMIGDKVGRFGGVRSQNADRTFQIALAQLPAKTGLAVPGSYEGPATFAAFWRLRVEIDWRPPRC